MAKPYWIKQQYNPQLGTYYVAMVQIGVREAMKHQDTHYRYNAMLRYGTQAGYVSACRQYEIEVR